MDFSNNVKRRDLLFVITWDIFYFNFVSLLRGYYFCVSLRHSYRKVEKIIKYKRDDFCQIFFLSFKFHMIIWSFFSLFLWKEKRQSVPVCCPLTWRMPGEWQHNWIFPEPRSSSPKLSGRKYRSLGLCCAMKCLSD